VKGDPASSVIAASVLAVEHHDEILRRDVDRHGIARKDHRVVPGQPLVGNGRSGSSRTVERSEHHRLRADRAGHGTDRLDHQVAIQTPGAGDGRGVARRGVACRGVARDIEDEHAAARPGADVERREGHAGRPRRVPRRAARLEVEHQQSRRLQGPHDQVVVVRHGEAAKTARADLRCRLQRAEPGDRDRCLERCGLDGPERRGGV
jgi:hypothetical protein